MSCCEQLITDLGVGNDVAACFSLSGSASEMGKKFRFDNPGRKTICKVQVDGCLITGNSVKCDYVFKVCEGNEYFLVELKGNDVDHAVKQIEATFLHVNSRLRERPERFKGRIVSSRVPAATESRFRKLQDKVLRERRFLITKTHIEHVERI